MLTRAETELVIKTPVGRLYLGQVVIRCYMISLDFPNAIDDIFFDTNSIVDCRYNNQTSLKTFVAGGLG